ncbi:MAG: S-methyl-5'-thioadenosine phosphorylase [Dehalococcoidia bacterium]|nr:S-methyl-5'-thioadenosine phosphorylase [Dehalococcoidia bacterium]
MPEPTLGFIGGSGLYDMEGLSSRREIEIETPFGEPSDSIITGELDGVEVAFLPRHGRGHRISPSELPVMANIYAMKQIGVQRLVSISAVGSLKEELKPLDLVVPDQIIDRTRERPSTFFGDGLVAHVGFADPFCPALRQQAVEAAVGNTDVHDGGTYIVIEGPQFSTRAESEMHRSWGASVIGMTALPEAKLAREAEMCYATLAFVTDYDVWHEAEEDVSVELVVQNLMQNVQTAQTIVRRMASTVSETTSCGCDRALENAIITSRDLIPPTTRMKLGLLVDKYLD